MLTAARCFVTRLPLIAKGSGDTHLVSWLGREVPLGQGRSVDIWRTLLEQSYKRSPSMVARKIGDEVILVPIRNNVGDLACIYSLNEVGAFVWDRIDGGQAVPSLVEAVCGEFEADRGEVERDLREFLGQLEQIGAVSAG